MLKALHLGNFKAFGAPVRVPIRPLTLIFGPNSAGKSSLIHGLALGHEALRRRRLDITRTKLGGDSIDLGGFRQYVHRRALEQQVTWGVEVDSEEHPLNELIREIAGTNRFSMFASFGLPLDDEGNPVLHAKPALARYQIEIGDESILRMSRRPGGELRIDDLSALFSAYVPRFVKRAPGAFRTVPTWNEMEFQKSVLAVAATPLGLYPKLQTDGSKQDALLQTLSYFLNYVHRHVEFELSRLAYLGPLRSYPPRHIAFSEHDDANWTAGGGRAWDRMRKSKALRDAVNAWLGSEEHLQTPYKIALRKFVAPQTAQNALGAGLDEILASLTKKEEHKDDDDIFASLTKKEEHEDDDEISDGASLLDRWDRDEFVKVLTRKLQYDRDVEGDADLVLVDMRTNTTVSHRDVGIGISQVLPVLVEAYGNEKRLVAIEQPEIHLHPRLQAELADVFLESALGERRNTFLLETHSEHLILRVLRRIRETTESRLPAGLPPVRPEDVAVLSVVPDSTGARIVEIPITEDGEFAKPWPGGFFPERRKELY